jgi:hypothetical protein
MQTKLIEPEMALLNLNRQELIILNNALNEVCHGLRIVDFSTRIGATHDEAKYLLDQIGNLIDEMGTINKDRYEETD